MKGLKGEVYMNNSNQLNSFELILHAGNAKSSAIEAINAANNENYELVESKLNEAGDELTMAHQMQTDLLMKMMKGEEVPVDILMVHAQDHLSNAILMNELAKQFIEMKKEIQELRKQLNEK